MSKRTGCLTGQVKFKGRCVKLKEGDYVTVISNAQGTAWESGVIMDINKDGAMIGYGSRNCPRSYRLYGIEDRREPLYNLKLRMGD